MEPPSPIQALGVNPLMGSWNTAVVPSKTIPDCIPNGAKSIPVFRPKRRKNPYPLVLTLVSSEAETRKRLSEFQHTSDTSNL